MGNVHRDFSVVESTITGVRQSRLALPAAPLVLAALVAAVAAYGAWRIDPADGYDGGAHLAYAQVLEEQGRLPTEAETYEYATPPAYPWLAVQLHRLTGTWASGQALAALWAAGLVLLAWLLARELWPRRPTLWAAAAALTAAMPIVVRLGTMLHPETQLAFFAALAVLLFVRAARLGWPWPYGAGVGVAVGLAALTRPTAAAVALALAAAALLAGRPALRFGAVALVALALVAGPWWGYQGARFGNPLQSNLDRYILTEGQPREFWISAPVRDLVVHPYRPAFAGELWPQFHADLWSDWFGGQHDYWSDPAPAATRVLVSAQSVLGLLFTPVAIAGIVLLRRQRALALLVLVSWIGLVVQLVRFPQAGGDPIKASYMLYLAPVFAVAAVEAGRRLPRPAVLAWAALYGVSYAGFLATSWR